MMSAEIVERDGKLFVLDPWQSHFSEPIQYRTAWPTGISAKDYPHFIGQKAESGPGGTYRLESGILIRLEHAGATHPDRRYTEEKQIRRPRGNYKYHSGRWQKNPFIEWKRTARGNLFTEVDGWKFSIWKFSDPIKGLGYSWNAEDPNGRYIATGFEISEDSASEKALGHYGEFVEDEDTEKTPNDIIASLTLGTSVYKYVIVPETISDPVRHGFRVMMNVDGGAYETAGLGWSMSRESILERLAKDLFRKMYTRGVATIHIYDSQLQSMYDYLYNEKIKELEEGKREEEENRRKQKQEYEKYTEAKQKRIAALPTYKWKRVKDFQIDTDSGKVFVPAVVLQGSGLGIHKSPNEPKSAYRITHQRTGLRIGNVVFDTLGNAKVAVVRLVKQFDWNLSKEEMMKTKNERADWIRKMDRDVHENPPRSKRIYSMELTSEEKILLTAFRFHERLGMENIPGYLSDAIVELEGKGLIVRLRGSGKTPSGPAWEITPKGRKVSSRKNPPLSWDRSVGDIADARGILNDAVYDLEKVKGSYEILIKLGRVNRLLSDAMTYLHKSHLSDFTFEHNPPMREVYRDILEIKARKKDGRLYRHAFKPGSTIFGLPDGSLVVKSRKGKKLWKNFPKGKK